MRFPRSLAVFSVVVLVAAVFVGYTYKKRTWERLWTADEISFYNGTDEQKPILLGILGSVFDVTKGRSHYGPGGGYHHFAGSERSILLILDLFPGTHQERSFQEILQMKTVVDWRGFYVRTYVFVGKLVGIYYDSYGNPTKYLKGVEAKAARGAQLLEKQKLEESKLPSCNSKWSDKDGGEVWCDSRYPRLVQRPFEIELKGRMSKRCVCFKEEELQQPGLEVYEGCDPLSKSCRV